MNKIYVIICGFYEGEHNEYVTTDIDDAINFAFSKCNSAYKLDYDSLNAIEVWENGVLVKNYGSLMRHKINDEHISLSFQELKDDFEKYINEI